nr:hypothetical protein [Acidithiobacillus ferrianus]
MKKAGLFLVDEIDPLAVACKAAPRQTTHRYGGVDLSRGRKP